MFVQNQSSYTNRYSVSALLNAPRMRTWNKTGMDAEKGNIVKMNIGTSVSDNSVILDREAYHRNRLLELRDNEYDHETEQMWEWHFWQLQRIEASQFDKQ